MGLIVVLLLAINFGISWWNARVVGLDWIESKHIGGWVRFMVWMGWLQSSLGFTWCYVILLAFLAKSAGYIDAQAMEATLSLGYLVVIPGILLSGTFIWIDFRNGPLGVKPPSDDLATVIVLPSVVDTRVATSCHQMGAGEPI
jgi:hypothetical protein